MSKQKPPPERTDGRTETLAQEYTAWLEDMARRFDLSLIGVTQQLARELDDQLMVNVRAIDLRQIPLHIKAT